MLALHDPSERLMNLVNYGCLNLSHCDRPKLFFLQSVLASFLHRCYEWPKWCSFVLNALHDKLLLTMTYLVAPLHSCVDSLNMNIRCRHKEGVTLRPQYLCGFYIEGVVIM